MRWPLDHVFHSADFRFNDIRRLPGFGSDHFPLLVDLQLEGDPKKASDGLAKAPADAAWAEEKLKAEGVNADQVP